MARCTVTRPRIFSAPRRRLNVRTILDVGCGSGDNLEALSRENRYVLTGVDVSEEALTIARRRVPKATLGTLDVQREVLPTRHSIS